MVPYSYFIHPDDEKAMNAMKSVPGFDRIVKKFMEYGYEFMVNSENLASYIRLSETQLPHIYRKVTRICDRLEIPYPQVYLCMSPYPNAWTYGDTDVSITLTSALFEYLEDDEIDSVIAHECGHILCHHVLYHTLARFVCMGINGILSDLTTPLRLAVNYWQRQSELSADRVAALISGADTVVRTQLRLSGGPKSLTSKVNIKEWSRQAEEYDELCKGNAVDNLIQKINVMDQSHPFSAVRVHEVIEWTSSKDFQMIKDITLGKANICPHCHKPVYSGWTYCRHCGEKIKVQDDLATS